MKALVFGVDPGDVPALPEHESSNKLLDGLAVTPMALQEWRDAFTALACQDESDAIKVAFDFR